MFFSIYNTTIDILFKQCDLCCQIYAVDTALYTEIELEDKQPLIGMLRLKVKEWFGALQFCSSNLNRNETKIILLSTKKKHPNIRTLKLDNIVLNISKNLVKLGTNVDEHLSLEKRVNNIKSSCYNELRKLYRTQH